MKFYFDVPCCRSPVSLFNLATYVLQFLEIFFKKFLFIYFYYLEANYFTIL